ncbi:MAG TPA: SCP2 sterol-binding domain-containing protein [Acidimicrobiales bacterium]|nr:SCP2 sterol-binding domain-containing protein [Acidimicrobiales bacterium]
MTITLEEHGPPIVHILGGTLRRASTQPKLARTMERLNGRVALKSTTDPQAVTIAFAKGAVHVAHGADPAADVTISVDLNTMGRPGAPKPKVKGAARHLGFALGVSKVLDPPTPGGWAGAVDEFWAWADGRAGLPDQLRVVCTDEGGETLCGSPGTTSVEVHGPAWALLGVFTGGDHLGAAILEHRVQVVADFPALSRFVGVISQLLLGRT